MVHWKLLPLVALTALVISPTGSAACHARQPEAQQPNRPAGQAQQSTSMEITTLKQGAYSDVPDPLLLVVRDRETYLVARREIKDLPEVAEDFFRGQALVAAFLGTRNTGGYGVDITLENNVVKVRPKNPPADAMTTQAFSYPFAVAAVKATNEQALNIDAGANWKMRPYRVTAGELKVSGGLAGRERQSSLGGEIGVLRHAALATFSFNLKKDGAQGELKAVTTGIVDSGGRLKLSLPAIDGLVDSPHGLLEITGAFANNEEQLTLLLKTAPANVEDGFSAQGKIEAKATGPALPKSEKREVVF